MKRNDRNKISQERIVDTKLYDAWIRYVFDRDVTMPGWYHAVDVAAFKATPEEFALLLSQTFLRSGHDLTSFSDAQVNQGLWYIFDNACSDLSFIFTNENVPEATRITATGHIKHLYRDCFAQRCTPTLSHIDEANGGDLNMVCYMLWDITPILAWNKIVLEVLEDALAIPHVACIESALHGLGHYTNDRKQAAAIIDQFLSHNKQLRPALAQYAQNARGGCIQ